MLYILLYISYILIKKKNEKIELETTTQYIPDTYLKGFVINISNPKAILFFSTIITPFIQKDILINLIVLFFSLCSGFLIIIIATFFRNLLNNNIFYIIDKICSIVFIFFSLDLFYHVLIIYNSL